ncbi:hypothetical protein HPP92_025831 [Vanilla planifolia]|uniref:Uncharacterized protein n=1 Tax=Vanilla planifolia TaxID=51239 RepID=A0A835PKB7_VANPL|nr:hypothetical protein HPP92_025831 [Vanilla planifolia]
MDRIKEFVDILVLASGYQSSGLPAVWDVENIKKAVRWGLFFEDVFKCLRHFDCYEESVKELDAVLSSLTSNPFFPAGLAHMSSATLSNARGLVLERLLHSHAIRNDHLLSLLRAVVEMDINELSESDDGSHTSYVEKLILQMEKLDLVPAGIESTEKSNSFLNDVIIPDCIKYDRNLHAIKMSDWGKKERTGLDNSLFIMQEILSRQAVMSCMCSFRKSINNLSEIIIGNCMVKSESMQLESKSDNGVTAFVDQSLNYLYQFRHWRTKCISYLLDNRTLKLLSGSDLILSAPNEQWVRVFEELKLSTNLGCDNMLEIVEILLLGLISSKWNYLIQLILSISCDFLSTAKKLSDLQELLEGNTLDMQINKEKEMLDYLTQLLKFQPQKLWELPSILVAAAIPSWSSLFRMHLREVAHKFNEPSSSRCCECNQDGSEHHDCQVGERIQSLFAFHIRCPQRSVNI